MGYRHVVLVDKPKGITSHDAVQLVKRALGAARAGHSGTLDSNATGLLLVALDEARKAMPVLFGLQKEYTGTIWLHGDVPAKRARQAAGQFLGRVAQVPPKRSRVVRKLREREVFSFRVTGLRGRELKFRVKCQAGFYVRKLAHDLGLKLGCGAHLAELRRTRVGPFSIRGARPPRELKKEDLIRLEAALEKVKLKRVVVKDPALGPIRNGAPVKPEDLARKAKLEPGQQVGIFDRKGNIVALGGAQEGRIKTDRVFNI